MPVASGVHLRKNQEGAIPSSLLRSVSYLSLVLRGAMSGVKNPLGDIQNGRSSSTVFHLPWEGQEAKSVWWNTSLGSGEGRSFRSSIFRFYLVFLTVFVLFCMFTVLVHACNSSGGLEFKSSPIFYLQTPVKSAMVA